MLHRALAPRDLVECRARSRLDRHTPPRLHLSLFACEIRLGGGTHGFFSDALCADAAVWWRRTLVAEAAALGLVYRRTLGGETSYVESPLWLGIPFVRPIVVAQVMALAGLAAWVALVQSDPPTTGPLADPRAVTARPRSFTARPPSAPRRRAPSWRVPRTRAPRGIAAGRRPLGVRARARRRLASAGVPRARAARRRRGRLRRGRLGGGGDFPRAPSDDMSDHLFERPTRFAAPPCVSSPAATTYAQFAARAARSQAPEDFADDFGRSVLRECYDDVSVLDAHRRAAYAAAERDGAARACARDARAPRGGARAPRAPSRARRARAALADATMGRRRGARRWHRLSDENFFSDRVREQQNIMPAYRSWWCAGARRTWIRARPHLARAVPGRYAAIELTDGVVTRPTAECPSGARSRSAWRPPSTRRCTPTRATRPGC